MQTKTVNSSLPFIKVEFLFLARLKPDLPIFGNSFQYLLLVAVAEAVVLLVPKGRLLLKKAGKNNKTGIAIAVLLTPLKEETATAHSFF